MTDGEKQRLDSTETAPRRSVQRRVRRRPTRASDTYLLDGGGVLHIDRRITPVFLECSQCRKRKSDCTWDEGDMIWCLDCIEAWEKDNDQHWEDGSPLKPPNDKLTHGATP